MSLHTFFPTRVYTAPLQSQGAVPFNNKLLNEINYLMADDRAGKRWSEANYPGGYTSYASASRMHQYSPTFAALEVKLARHIKAYAKALAFDLKARPLTMTDCWVNVMPKGVVHSLHLHPLSTISGTYYVKTPPRASGLKLEDPRLDRFMAAPPRAADQQADQAPWVVMPAKAGHLILFESWLRHEVTANAASTDRVSISFNYSWF
jgi:uncharacterized protein (TIGR02466 family)